MPYKNYNAQSNLKYLMSCHYTCTTCSAAFYFDLCLTCPTSRSFTASTCPCSSGFYQVQSAQCTSQASIGGLDSALISIASYAYYASIAIHLLFMILMINRILSIKLKKIVDTLQVLAVINYYRFVQPEVASKSLKAIQAFNFEYFTNFVCQKTKPPLGCNVFENLFGIGFTLIAFFLLVLVSYFISVCIYNRQSSDENVIYIKDGKQRNKQSDDTLDFLTFWATLSSSIMLLYLDQTAIQTTLAICRIAIVNYYGLIAAIPFIFLIIFVVRKHFTTINSSKQTTLAYRAQNSYFYIYDEQYHLYYIDHLFEDDNLGKDADHVRNPYYPQSNLIIMETLYKILIAVSAIVFYQYSPNLFVYCCLFLLLISSCLLKVFWTYQIFDLWFYYIMIGVQAFAFGVFYISSFFKYFIIFTVLSLQLLAVMIIITSISSWKKDKEGEIFIKIFQLTKQNRAKVSNLDESEAEINKSSKKSVNQQASKLPSSQQESINPDHEQENKQLKKRIERQYEPEPIVINPRIQRGKFSQPNITKRQSVQTFKDANISNNFEPVESVAQPPSINRITSRKTSRSYSVVNKLGNKGQGVKSLETIQQKKPQDNIANNTGSRNIFQL